MSSPKTASKKAPKPAAGDLRADVLLFSLEELPGFCRKHGKVIAALTPACLKMPILLDTQPSKSKTTFFDALVVRVPEKGTCSKADAKRMFFLIEKVADEIEDSEESFANQFRHRLYDEVGEDYALGVAFHDGGTVDQIAAALGKMPGVNVERAPAAFSKADSSELNWLVSRDRAPSAMK